MKRVIGFDISDDLFSGESDITRHGLSAQDVKRMLDEQNVISLFSQKDKAFLDVLRVRFGIDVSVSENPPPVGLHDKGDSIIVVSSGLSQLDRHEYTAQEIASAGFSFAMYTVYTALDQ